MSRIVSVSSFRGGTGKSNMTANRATAVAMTGKRSASSRPTSRPISGQAKLAHREGGADAARELYNESLTLFGDLGNRQDIAEVLEGLAEVAVSQTRYERAARLLGAAEALREAISAPLLPSERVEVERYLAAARAGLVEEPFAAAWEAGRAMWLEDAVALALQDHSDA